jgi:O-succinylbenzoate synthase
LRVPLRESFAASYGQEHHRDVIVVEVETQTGAVGVSECVAMSEPLYLEETAETAWWMLRRYLAPAALCSEWQSIEDIGRWSRSFERFRGHRMAKAAMEMAVWDAWCAETSTPLPVALGAAASEIPAGISIGIQPDVDALLRRVEQALAAGYARVKVKIRPGWDVEPLRAIRKVFGDIPLMADANSAYRLEDAGRLRELDEIGLLMIEQPLGWDDLVDHARLQRDLQTPVCLDESIRSAEDVRRALDIGACRVVNLKVGRVGGFAEALRIHALCLQAGVPLWCGGMYETGIGRLHNTVLSALPGFTIPGDTGPSDRYYDEDLIDPPVVFSRPGVLPVEPLCGVAGRVRWNRLEKWRIAVETFRAGR